MVATMRSFLLFLFLASACLFKMATTYPHFGMERVPLAESPHALNNRTIAYLKRQDGASVDWEACEVDPAVCGLPIDTSNKPPPLEEVPPVNPPGRPTCEPRPPGKYFDAHERKVRKGAKWFCGLFAQAHKDQDRDTYLATLPITSTVEVGGHFFNAFDSHLWTGNHHRRKDVYSYRVEWIEHCKPDPRTGLDAMKPLNDFECSDLLFDAWKQCDNAGRGGSIMAGCFNFRVHTNF